MAVKKTMSIFDIPATKAAREDKLSVDGRRASGPFRQMCVAEEERIAEDLNTCRALSSDSGERHVEVPGVGVGLLLALAFMFPASQHRLGYSADPAIDNIDDV
ncbi:unnamed protein product [Cyclocybe aegerita]|uniref:Uncharacterized protein n=1 Tax=Cyclocybe aegerita TaxID=1973307 RepID=A0A8S0XRA7_CYCAE|nr:unnamed protein product [Cyclocybe aegerita]